MKYIDNNQEITKQLFEKKLTNCKLKIYTGLEEIPGKDKVSNSVINRKCTSQKIVYDDSGKILGITSIFEKI